MAANLVHIGPDTCNWGAALKSIGCSVTECHSLAALHAALVGVPPADAVVITEKDGVAPHQAISMVRATSVAPLILFQNENPNYDPGEFDLVIPPLMEAGDWLTQTALLLATQRASNFSTKMPGNSTT